MTAAAIAIVLIIGGPFALGVFLIAGIKFITLLRAALSSYEPEE